MSGTLCCISVRLWSVRSQRRRLAPAAVFRDEFSVVIGTDKRVLDFVHSALSKRRKMMTSTNLSPSSVHEWSADVQLQPRIHISTFPGDGDDQ